MKTEGKKVAYLKRWLWGSVAGALFYGWLIAEAKPQQGVAAALIGPAVAAAVLAFARHAEISFRLEWGKLGRLLLHLPMQAARDIGLLLALLWRDLIHGTGTAGRYCRKPSQSGTRGPRSAARRALILFEVSFPPNTFVVLEPGEDSLLVHQLANGAQPERGTGTP